VPCRTGGSRRGPHVSLICQSKSEHIIRDDDIADVDGRTLTLLCMSWDKDFACACSTAIEKAKEMAHDDMGFRDGWVAYEGLFDGTCVYLDNPKPIAFSDSVRKYINTPAFTSCELFMVGDGPGVDIRF
jgi:hypothetical protein